MKKEVKKPIEIEEMEIEIEAEDITVSEVEDEDEEEEEEEEDENITEIKNITKKKQSGDDLYSSIMEQFDELKQLEQTFNEKEKQFEKDQKEFQLSKKKISQTLSSNLKKFNKIYNSQINKKKKPRNTENAGKGGFNKLNEVPDCLRSYIGLEKSDIKSRPQVTLLLNQKFRDNNLVTTKNDNGKEIKMIILDKATAKALKRPEGTEIRARDIQTFIAQFYKEQVSSVQQS